jgi:hypothetical protein
MSDLFSETSRLYAENYPTIEFVENTLRQEVDTFLDTVRDKIRSAVGDKAREQKAANTGYRYWWIGGPHYESHACLWLVSERHEVVPPGKVTFQACAPRGSGRQWADLRELANRPEFKEVCEADKGKLGSYSLFIATVKYGTRNPAQRVAEITVKLLRAMSDTYERASRGARRGSAGNRA